MEPKSKITGGDTTYLFTTKVLGKYDVKYFKCNATGFIQTEEPYWLNEAYASAITALDIGLLFRNNKLSKAVEKIIGENLNVEGNFIDYAGGYGVFTRLMRDKGYNFYHTDKFCENIFTKFFDVKDTPIKKFEAATAFELFEHLANPLVEIKEILTLTDTIIFSTEIVPNNHIKSPEDWWYFAPETGQHIAFYTVPALEYIAQTLNLNLYTNKANLHILSAKKLNPTLFKNIKNPFGKVKIVYKKSDAYFKNHKNNSLKKLEFFIVKNFETIKQLFLGSAVEKRKSLIEEDVKHIKQEINKNKD